MARAETLVKLGAVTEYVVAPGDSLSAIAARHGCDWRLLYDHSLNARLRQQAPDPNLIQPGWRVYIPASF